MGGKSGANDQENAGTRSPPIPAPGINSTSQTRAESGAVSGFSQKLPGVLTATASPTIAWASS